MGSMLRPSSRGLLKPKMDPILALRWAHEPLQIADIGACGEQKTLRCACPPGQEGAQDGLSDDGKRPSAGVV